MSVKLNSVTLLRETVNGIERSLAATQSYDLRNAVPSKNYGIHNLDLTFQVKRGNVGVTWRLFSGWYLKQLRPMLNRTPMKELTDGLGSLDYHSPVPLYVDHTSMNECDVTGGKCYPDGSGLASSELFDKFVEDPVCVWVKLEEWLLNTEARVKEQIELAQRFT